MLFLGKYESLGVLGRGGMSKVHAARVVDDPATTVVVKVMRSDLAETPRARQFFDREAKYTTRLRHPFIVRVLEAGVDPAAGPCIVMEFVPGITLEHLLRTEKRVALRRAMWLMGCLCHALEAAHKGAVIHRDLKPANLMVVGAGTPQEHLKVMDFGLAYLLSRPFLSKEQFARSDEVITQGTPAYIAPEQLRGDSVDGRADLYSSGIVLFEMLTGCLPFEDRNVSALAEAHLHQAPPTFAELGIRDIPVAIEDVVRRCLAKFPAERPASPRALAVELGRAAGTDLWALTTPIDEIRTQAQVPMADEMPADPTGIPDALVRTTEAWMPDKIAVIKLGGFLEDAGGKLVNTQPGLLQARFVDEIKPVTFLERLFGKAPPPKPTNDGIDLDLNLEKPNPSESRLVITAVFRVTDGGPPKNRHQWTSRCLNMFEEMKRYLMAGG